MSRSEERRIRKERKLQERLAARRWLTVRRGAKRWGLYGGLGHPPTGIQDHVESYPSCRICAAPIPEAVQKHILEHREPGAPGDRPGILVQYNCAPCPEVVAKLTRIVERYPRGVYLAPYPSMSPRIALTTLGRLEAMDDVDETRVSAFIERHL